MEQAAFCPGNLVPGIAASPDKMLQAAVFFKADPDYGRRVAEGLGLDVSEVERLAAMSQEERAKATEEGSYT